MCSAYQMLSQHWVLYVKVNPISMQICCCLIHINSMQILTSLYDLLWVSVWLIYLFSGPILDIKKLWVERVCDTLRLSYKGQKSQTSWRWVSFNDIEFNTFSHFQKFPLTLWISIKSLNKWFSASKKRTFPLLPHQNGEKETIKDKTLEYSHVGRRTELHNPLQDPAWHFCTNIDEHLHDKILPQGNKAVSSQK